MKNDKLTYTDAVAELEAILRALENTDEVDMDRVSASVKRATELMEFCKKKLHTLDESLEKMIAEL